MAMNTIAKLSVLMTAMLGRNAVDAAPCDDVGSEGMALPAPRTLVAGAALGLSIQRFAG